MRIIARSKILIRFIGTHAGYDVIDAKKYIDVWQRFKMKLLIRQQWRE